MAESKFNNTKFFDKIISDKAQEIKKLCEDAKIPFFMCFCVENNEKTTKYKNYIFGAVSAGIRLTDDRITGHINVANGFKTVPSSEHGPSVEKLIENAEEGREKKAEDTNKNDTEDEGFDDE